MSHAAENDGSALPAHVESVSEALAAERTTLLVTVTGPDFPGVSATLFTVLAEHGAEMLDVQQATIHG
ncbi:MAG TPA: ACT domain-containing protein, partial [Mycobacterium sp.]|nr:ACT domain-containing protein [Mycobacterium sp.]